MDTPSERLRALLLFVPDLKHRQLDEIAGLGGSQTWAVLNREGGGMSAETARAYAEALGARAEWLLLGTGDPPAARTVQGAVRRSREKLRRERVEHGARVAPPARARKGNARTGETKDRCKRAVGGAR